MVRVRGVAGGEQRQRGDQRAGPRERRRERGQRDEQSARAAQTGAEAGEAERHLGGASESAGRSSSRRRRRAGAARYSRATARRTLAMSEPFPNLEDLDRAHLLHPITEFRVHEKKGPRVLVGGEGIRLRTRDGRSVIDGFSGLFNINVGHGRREIADAVAAQMRELAYYPSFWDFSTQPAIALADRLAQRFPPAAELGHMIFTSGGSDANETAFRFARLYQAVMGRPSRTKILSRKHGFHGITRASGSATRIGVYHVFAQPDPLHVDAAAPYCFRCDLGKTYPSCGVACADDVEAVIAREGEDTVAAVIVEPVLGTGGIVPPPAEYFAKLQAICARHDVLLLLDEVITGFGRTGRWFGMEHWDVRPDLVTFAKGVTSGYLPLGGVAMSQRVYEAIRDRSPQGLPFMGGLTYNNHPTCCAAALANLDILEREGLVENARVTGAYLLACLREAFSDHAFVGDLRGLGMLAAIETTQPHSKDPVGGKPMQFPARVAQAAWERGLIVRALWENVALAPPLVATRADVDEIVDILAKSFAEASKQFAAA
ncbi:MAG: aspartate aminotransferase family protein [Proteobacteria bacterium]|nr:MAG: aspartate aminotransferase family protein [Pseudomonadota bacterium]